MTTTTIPQVFFGVTVRVVVSYGYADDLDLPFWTLDGVYLDADIDTEIADSATLTDSEHDLIRDAAYALAAVVAGCKSKEYAECLFAAVTSTEFPS